MSLIWCSEFAIWQIIREVDLLVVWSLPAKSVKLLADPWDLHYIKDKRVSRACTCYCWSLAASATRKFATWILSLHHDHVSTKKVILFSISLYVFRPSTGVTHRHAGLASRTAPLSRHTTTFTLPWVPRWARWQPRRTTQCSGWWVTQSSTYYVSAVYLLLSFCCRSSIVLVIKLLCVNCELKPHVRTLVYHLFIAEFKKYLSLTLFASHKEQLSDDT